MGPMKPFAGRGDGSRSARQAGTTNGALPTDQELISQTEEALATIESNLAGLKTKDVSPASSQTPLSSPSPKPSNASPASFDPFSPHERPVPRGNSLPAVIPPDDEERPQNPARAVIRGQTPGLGGPPVNTATPGNGDYLRYPMQPSGTPIIAGQNAPQTTYQPFIDSLPPPVPQNAPLTGPNNLNMVPPGQTIDTGPILQPFSQPNVPVDVFVEEARTGRFMFGAGVNSDLGVTGQIVIDEKNFDPFRTPTSWEDVVNGTAWRGAGQGLRIEAMPGSQVHRYLVTHTVPYLYLPGVPEPFVLSTSGFFYTRRYFDWDEQRIGGRVALGYRITPDLSLTGSFRGENIKIFEPRVVGLVPELDRVLGNNDLFSGRLTLTHDTRDNAFLATQGHMVELAFEQTFGAFDYPRAELDYRQYFLMRERPDGSGRHTLAYSFRVGVSGTDTPIFENYYSGGYSTMRGFDFRGASPIGPAGVQVGGQFRALGSVEYFFPVTADDMIKGVVFCDFGTTEEHIEFHPDNYRVAPGIGLRINIPAMGPAPLALDLAVPVAHAPGDNIQNFSFFFGFSR
jgi:outer membrane protein insertion porin family